MTSTKQNTELVLQTHFIAEAQVRSVIFAVECNTLCDFLASQPTDC